MSYSVISSQIEKKLSEINPDNKSILVIKGMPMSAVDSSVGNINLTDVVSNKLGYFMSLVGKRKFLTYEEFLLLADFVVSQYSEVYILNNNIYMEQYPVEEYFESTIREGMLTHFSESEEGENDERLIGEIDEYVSIFEGLKECKGGLLGVYSDIPALHNTKVININIFEEKKEDILLSENSPGEFFELIEESDFIDFMNLLISSPEEIYVRISNYTGDVSRLKNHLAIVAHYWKDFTEIFYLQAQHSGSDFKHRDEYTDILKKYWGYESFRNLKVYDMNRLAHGEKIVTQVSQEAIIANLVEEVEHCGEGNDFRDIFVTAPTGAGKSVMFQIPAIYLAEKQNLLTIVISPLIGLMNDQVKNLEFKNYPFAKTINSDISPVIKQDIVEKVKDSQYHILYISPETLLSRSDVEQLIGNRTIGMIVIDEAHIVTTWGKQFRPDYWYLGDHIRKLRKKQMETKKRSFVISTFTATAIYHGLEDMYTETINSLHMLNPITYLGYIKRDDIDIVVRKTLKKKGNRTEYELDKFEQIEGLLKRAIITNKKTLIYFPTVALIERCYEYLRSNNKVSKVAMYHGSMRKELKQQNYEEFLAKDKLLMLATKAFGMGIDINDIEIVAHFAPTGNVCDYVQEIGRASRREDLRGEALYNYSSRDFKHINRLHGLSTIQKYQLVKVIEKIYEIYQKSIQGEKRKCLTKRRNAMLLDAENFSYIFGSPISDEDSNVNKVKTALLLIQKDFESKVGFSPVTVRPVPMFSIGFFRIEPGIQEKLNRHFTGSVEEIEHEKHICRVMLSTIWNKGYKVHSFPKFKYMLYIKDSENLDIVTKYPMTPALCVSISFENDYASLFNSVWTALKGFIGKKVISSEHTAIEEIAVSLTETCNINRYRALSVCEVVIASMDSYRKNHAKTMSPIVQEKTTKGGKTKYQFNVAVNSYFSWVEEGLGKIEKETSEGKLYLINDNGKRTQEYSAILGILESIGVLTFEMLGGANSQLYIYVNQIQALKNIINAPQRYNNRLVEAIAERHFISVKMLTYLYEGDFSSEEIWNLLEDYFLGAIPEGVKNDCRKEKPEINFD